MLKNFGWRRWPPWQLIVSRASAARVAPIILILVAFAASRWFYHGLGLVFYWQPIEFFIQIADRTLLQHDLLRTIFYLHIQPPLFNLAVGLVLKAFPVSYVQIFHALFFLMGAAYAVGFFLLLARLGVDRSFAVGIALIHAVSPSTARYEHWLFYEYPVAAAFCFTALALQRYVATGRQFHGAAFFWLLAGISLTRNIVPWWWMLLWAGAVAAVVRGGWRRVVKVAVLPMLLVAAVAIKHRVVFGTPDTAELLFGGNLAHRFASATPPLDRALLIKEEGVSPMTFIPLFSHVQDFRSYIPSVPVTGIPALDNELKANGQANINCLAYRYIAREYLTNVKKMARLRPDYYWNTWKGIYPMYVQPSGDDAFARVAEPPKMAAISDFFDLVVCGQRANGRVGWTLAIGLPLLILFGLWRLREWKSGQVDKTFTIAFMLANILFSIAVTWPISYGDYNRYRFNVNAYYAALFGLAATAVFHRFFGARHEPSA